MSTDIIDDTVEEQLRQERTEARRKEQDGHRDQADPDSKRRGMPGSVLKHTFVRTVVRRWAAWPEWRALARPFRRLQY